MAINDFLFEAGTYYEQKWLCVFEVKDGRLKI